MDDEMDFLDSDVTGDFGEMGVSGLGKLAEDANENTPEVKAEAAPEEAPVEEPEVKAESGGEDVEEDAEEAEGDLSESDLAKKALESYQASLVPEGGGEPEPKIDPRDELAREQLEALRALNEKISGGAEEEVEEQESKIDELLSSPAIQSQVREILETGSEEKLLPLMVEVARLAAEEKTSGEVQRLSDELTAMRGAQYMTQRLQQVTSTIEGNLSRAKSKSPVHEALVEQLMDGEKGANSVLAKEIAKIGDEGQRTAILSNPDLMARWLDGVVYNVQSGGAQPGSPQVASVGDDVVEESGVQSSSANKGQRIGKKKNKAPSEEQIDAELFGEKSPTTEWEMLQTARGI